MHYYKFNIGDWHLATSHLSLEEEAIYFRLINFYYDTEKPIPTETHSVFRRLRLGSHSVMALAILDEFFRLGEDGWHHKMCDEKLITYHSNAQKNRENGKLGGRPPKNGAGSKGKNPVGFEDKPKDNPTKTLTNNHKPITNNQKPIEKKKATIVACPPDVNEQVWSDWVQLRKAKKATVTETVVNMARKEAAKANISLEEFLAIWCSRGSQGLQAAWLEDKNQSKPNAGDRNREVMSGLTRGLIGGSNDVGLLGK